jgi:hypothetical protein
MQKALKKPLRCLSPTQPKANFTSTKPTKRHLDRSDGRSYRPLRSGEIRVFRLCSGPCIKLRQDF